MNGQTPRSRAYYRHMRPSLDRESVRHFVYFLLDTDGIPVYIGRSCEVAKRIRAHYHTLTNSGLSDDKRATWLLECRSVTMVGPFNWDQAVARERAEIERHQPRGNRDLTKRDRRPAVAARSARAAS